MATAQQLVDVARHEAGYLERRTNRTKFAAEAGHPNGYAWCHTFVVALLRRLGVSVPAMVLLTAFTPTAANAFKAAGRWVKPEDIEPGDIVFFDFPDAKDRVQHVGIATESVRRRWLRLGKRYVTCVEGNTSAGRAGSQDNGGGVFERTRPLSHAVGAGRPVFDLNTTEEAHVADLTDRFVAPSWGKRQARTRLAPTYRLDIDPGNPTTAVVCAFNGAPLDGGPTAKFGTVPFKKVTGLASPPVALLELPDGQVVVHCDAGHQYAVATKPAA